MRLEKKNETYTEEDWKVYERRKILRTTDNDATRSRQRVRRDTVLHDHNKQQNAHVPRRKPEEYRGAACARNGNTPSAASTVDGDGTREHDHQLLLAATESASRATRRSGNV